MKQATLKAAGTAVLGLAIAAVGAGSASADPVAAGGLGLPTGAVTNPAVTGAVTDTASKLPGGDKVAGDPRHPDPERRPGDGPGRGRHPPRRMCRASRVSAAPRSVA